jgi:hypothetical protein
MFVAVALICSWIVTANPHPRPLWSSVGCTHFSAGSRPTPIAPPAPPEGGAKAVVEPQVSTGQKVGKTKREKQRERVRETKLPPLGHAQKGSHVGKLAGNVLAHMLVLPRFVDYAIHGQS